MDHEQYEEERQHQEEHEYHTRYEPSDQPVDMCKHCQKSDDWAICFDCYDKIQKYIQQLESKLSKIQAKVDEQANDEGLWFEHKYITEDYLQRALRELHKTVEKK